MSQMPDKIWINPLIDLPKLSGVIDKDSVQYVRKDALIEKACKWLREGGSGWYLTSESGGDEINFVKLAEDFRKAMEDE